MYFYSSRILNAGFFLDKSIFYVTASYLFLLEVTRRHIVVSYLILLRADLKAHTGINLIFIDFVIQ